MHFNGHKFSSALEMFSFNPKFFGLRCKNQLFEEKMVLSLFLSNLNAGGNKLV